MNMWELGLIATGMALQIGLFVCLFRVTRTIVLFDKRLARLTDALSLLTETAEVGFRTNATEIGRIGGWAAARRSASEMATGRVAGAVRRGQSVEEIAATEQMSEGEVRLRLHLSDLPASRPSPAAVAR